MTEPEITELLFLRDSPARSDLALVFGHHDVRVSAQRDARGVSLPRRPHPPAPLDRRPDRRERAERGRKSWRALFGTPAFLKLRCSSKPFPARRSRTSPTPSPYSPARTSFARSLRFTSSRARGTCVGCPISRGPPSAPPCVCSPRRTTRIVPRRTGSPPPNAVRTGARRAAARPATLRPLTTREHACDVAPRCGLAYTAVKAAEAWAARESAAQA